MMVVLFLSNKTPLTAVYFVLLLFTVISVMLVQPANAGRPMLVTDWGMFIVVRLLQTENANSPIVVTEFGIVIEVRLEQLWNAA